MGETETKKKKKTKIKRHVVTWHRDWVRFYRMFRASTTALDDNQVNFDKTTKMTRDSNED